MLGSLSDAEDVVQEAWFRWQRVEGDEIRNPAAWLTTVSSRLALDRLRTQRRRREDYIGPWLPEPVSTRTSPAVGEDPARAAELAESMTLGFLVVLDRLGPIERAVFLLADVFGEPYADIVKRMTAAVAAARGVYAADTSADAYFAAFSAATSQPADSHYLAQNADLLELIAAVIHTGRGH
jgi:RNA polymerase sigma-70 factor (ECF subfamily)